jgi:hypothetical protein
MNNLTIATSGNKVKRYAPRGLMDSCVVTRKIRANNSSGSLLIHCCLLRSLLSFKLLVAIFGVNLLSEDSDLRGMLVVVE